MDGESQTISKLSCEQMYSWYFTREELEKLSPSRKDGITEKMESEIRQLYCSFIRDVGIRLKLPQMTIATAIMFCHRFYLHQSLAKNGWQTIATVCIFLASKVEDTPCPLDHVIRVAYCTIYRRDPATARRIHQKDVFEKQKAQILTGERLVLTTVRFDFNIQHPYRPLLDAMEKLGITQKEVKQVAWNFVNDWLKTTLCLQYKPQYIAAGSLYLAAKLQNIKLPVHAGHVWWHQFDIAPKPLEAVLQQMREMVHMKAQLFAHPSPAKQKEALFEGMPLISNSPDSVLTQSSLLVSSSSPEISDPNDHLQVDSSQDIVSMHIEDGGKSYSERNLMNMTSARNNPSKTHNKESLGQDLKIKHGSGVISCNQQIPLESTAKIGISTDKCVEQNVSICSNSRNTFNAEVLNQVPISWQSVDRANLCSEGGPLHTYVDSKSTQCVEPPTTNSNYSGDSFNVNSLCFDQGANSSAGTMEKASSVSPVHMRVDHLCVERRKVDVVRIKDLLMKRKRQRERQEQHIPSVDLSEEAWIEKELESGIVIKKADHAVALDDLSVEGWIERELESGIIIGKTNDKPVAFDGLSEDDWIERELESGIIFEPGQAGKKLKSSFC
ncbi:cyclin-T1-2-like [Oryza brachyantha]|uniref:Cyclin-like domain-containing protein n=1 Tax=Oryza brachyantha TaxID=4533 RepID=J3LCF8_ORYBR|nr:cyclin-T1-2-like [Oryza brachyantha]XP_006647236.1 cyclin-T1-2-like [Oryza brachyantha]